MIRFDAAAAGDPEFCLRNLIHESVTWTRQNYAEWAREKLLPQGEDWPAEC